MLQTLGPRRPETIVIYCSVMGGDLQEGQEAMQDLLITKGI